MAHIRAGTFHAPTEEPGGPLLELRVAFLRAVEDVCPQAMQEYRGLLGQDSPEAIAAWARKYHVSAEWCIEAAAAGLRLAKNGGPLRHLPEPLRQWLTVFHLKLTGMRDNGTVLEPENRARLERLTVKVEEMLERHRRALN